MARAKGTPKTGGRGAGTPNKVTGTLKEFIANLIDQNRGQIEKDLKRLEPKDRLAILGKLIGFIIPRQTQSDLQVMDWTKEKIEIVGIKSGHKPAHSESEVDTKRDKRFCCGEN